MTLRRRARRVSILDVMILIAASAVGLTLARTIFADASISPRLAERPATFFLLGLTLAYIPLRLVRPRPPLRRLACQPGFAAALAVAIVAAVDAVSWGIFWAKLKPEDAIEMVARYWRLSREHHGPAVAATWLGLALGRRWRPEPGWIDRVGRAIGVLWLVTVLLDPYLQRWAIVLPILFRRLTGAGP